MGKNGGAAAPVVPSVPISCQVKCGGCTRVLNVPAGIFDFQCPKCKLAQALPPVLRQQAQQGGARGIDASKIQLPCANCRAILNVPPGLTRFVCPQCRVELAVDPSKLQNYMTSLAQLNYMNAQNPGVLSSSANASSIADDAIARIPHFTGLAGFQEEVNEVALEVEQEEDEGGTSGDTFTDYRPSKLLLGPPHPDAIVETASLSAVQPPEPKYVPKIAEEKNVALSCLQLETIVYASQRHDHHLSDGSRSGFFLGDGAGVGKGRTIAGLIWENWHHGRRKSLWLSVGSDLKYDARRDLDDVGAKEVEVHALNKYSYGKLDSKSIGLKEGVIFLTYSSLIASADSGRTRLHQLVQWFGGLYDGLIVFDECHKAKNLIPEAGGQATRTGEAVLELQNRLPQARVVYCSATGASEPRNMGYMARLGLWGTGTDFPNFQAFLGALEKRGVGALELVAMDMKARGMYVCRTLSFKGAEFDISEVPLEPPMEEMYMHAVRVWGELRVQLLAAMDAVPEKKSRPNQSQLWRLYWASHQRFFRHMCMAAKVPAAVNLARQALEEGKCVVIGLQSTGEARTEEVITKQGVELDDFISGPRELLLKLVDEHFPLPEEPRCKPSGDEISRTDIPEKRAVGSASLSGKGKSTKAGLSENANDDVTEEEDDDETESDIEHGESDDDGRICVLCQKEDVTAEGQETIQCFQCGMGFHTSCLMPCPMETDSWVCSNCDERNADFHQAYKELWRRYDEAKERKREILEVIKGMGLPNNPLDDIIDQLGGPDAVAEMSGRRGMLVRAAKGKGVVYQVRNTKEVSMEMININEKQQFMDGKKLVAVISEAASAGVSLQADRRARNQRRRVHITLELPWSADRAIQQFGRTHRSNQTSAPQYRLLFTTLGGEKRFASIVAKRLETLGALTQGDRRSAGPSLSAFNYDSPYGKKALTVMYKAIMEQVVCPTAPPECTGPDTEDARKLYQDMRGALLAVGIIRDAGVPSGGKGNKHFGRILETDMHDVGRFLNRALGLPPKHQNRLFEFFVTIFDYLVHNARKIGQFDSGIVDIQANRVELHEQPRTFHVDPLSGAPTTLFVLEIDRGLTWTIASQILNDNLGEGHSPVNGFYQSIRQCLGRYHHLLAIERPGSRTGVRIFRPQSGEAPREMALAEFNSKYRKITSLESAETGWMGDYEITANQCMHGPKCKVGAACTVGKRIQIMHIIGGLILPVWGTVEKALATQAKAIHQRLRVVRVETSTNKQRIVGLHIPNAAVPTVRQGLDALQVPQD